MGGRRKNQVLENTVARPKSLQQDTPESMRWQQKMQ
jgi:hypothetical protein